jgi:predicted PurR-regulated permease PerM
MPKAAPDDAVRQLQALTNTLTKRLIEAEKRIAQLEKKNKVLSDRVNASSSASVTAIIKEVKRLGSQVKTISSNLEATPGYNAHNTFVCTSCGSKGKVAVPMRCTECGQGGWKGWFRKK